LITIKNPERLLPGTGVPSNRRNNGGFPGNVSSEDAIFLLQSGHYLYCFQDWNSLKRNPLIAGRNFKKGRDVLFLLICTGILSHA
jgi:hypothetical protein